MRIFAAILVFCASLASLPAAAQDFPSRPITFLLGFAPGGPSDVMARILGKKMEEVLKQPLVIENRTGAGGSVAGLVVARAAPDGYMIMLAPGSVLAINVTLYKNVGYDSEKDFEPITLVGTQSNVLYANPSVPAKDFAELVAQIKANPGKYNFGSGGIGTPAHLAGELLKLEAKLDMTHVPFRGTGPAMQAVIAGHIQLAFSPPTPLISHFEAGTLRAIAVTSPQRAQALAKVPTVAELGFPGFEAMTWHSLVAPAGTPKEVIAKLHSAAMHALQDPEVRRQFTDMGIEVAGTSPEALRAYIKSEIPKWAKIVRASGAKVSD